MRVYYNSRLQNLETNHEGFSEISQIMNSARYYSNAKVVFDLAKTVSTDGNMASVYAAMGYYLSKSENSLSIRTKNDKRLGLDCRYDLLGYQVNWGEFLKLRYWNGGTAVRGFSPGEYFKFNEYLINGAFDKGWWDIPVETRIDLKRYLRSLFRNASEYCNENDPIFISSSFRDRMLKFTLVDCGNGFLESISLKNKEIVNQQQAILWALQGNSSKKWSSGTLRSLAKYCSFNLGSLLIASGYSSVSINEEGETSFGELAAPFRGSIISISIYVPKQNFIEHAA